MRRPVPQLALVLERHSAALQSLAWRLPSLQCPKCLFVFCSLCNEGWHPGALHA